MPAAERRQHRRLPLRLPLGYRPAGSDHAYTGRAVTTDVSTTGVYFESGDESLREGITLDLCLTVPPNPGVSPYDTEVSTAGEIVRLVRLSPDGHARADAPARSGVAVRFNRPLQYDFPE